jgi:hypothetical protein
MGDEPFAGVADVDPEAWLGEQGRHTHVGPALACRMQSQIMTGSSPTYAL